MGKIDLADIVRGNDNNNNSNNDHNDDSDNDDTDKIVVRPSSH